VRAILLTATLAAVTSFAMAPGFGAFATLVDEYLDQFARRHPSIAAGNGLHAHDGTLEDLSAAAVAAEVTWLRAFRAKVDGVDASALTPDESVCSGSSTAGCSISIPCARGRAIR